MSEIELMTTDCVFILVLFVIQIGSMSTSFRGDWLPMLSSVMESIYKTATLSKSKQHLSLSTTVSQSISKTFPDFVKQVSRRISATYSKV